MCLDLRAERAYLGAERVKFVVNGIKSATIVPSLDIDHLIEILTVLVLAQADPLQIL
jgi:hypothetical protein